MIILTSKRWEANGDYGSVLPMAKVVCTLAKFGLACVTPEKILGKLLAGTIGRKNQIAFVGQGQNIVFPALSGREMKTIT